MKYTVLLALTVPLAALAGRAQEEAMTADAAIEPAPTAQNAPPNAIPQPNPLDEIDWMVGQWVDQSEESTVVTECSWAKNRRFLTRSFRVLIDDQTTLEGTQVIGWDPIAQRIRSWTFDSEGGFGESHWIRDGNRWLAKSSFTLASGELASAVNVTTYVDQDAFRWQSIDREVGGQWLPNIPEVTVVRQKPESTGPIDDSREESP